MNLIRNNISLKEYNTFGIEAVARKFVIIDAVDKLQELIKSGILVKNNVVILGNGSNVLFVNPVVEKVVLVNRIRGIDVVKESVDGLVLEAGSGEMWSEFVDFTTEKGLWGLENLSLIPGTIGAAPVQNVGAFGVEQKNSFQYLKALNLLTGELKTFNKNECQFGYRNSFFKRPENKMWFITAVAYNLSRLPMPVLEYGALKNKFAKRKNITPKEVSNFIKEVRTANIPDTTEQGNAGSFFKNPEIKIEKLDVLREKFENIPFYKLNEETAKIPAAWLIEHCGWKGKNLGNAGVSKNHALIIVNNSNATGKEIVTLSNRIKNDVYKMFGIELEPEVSFID